MKRILCKICNKEIGKLFEEDNVLNIYDKKDVGKYIGQNLIIKINCCNNIQYYSLTDDKYYEGNIIENEENLYNKLMKIYNFLYDNLNKSEQLLDEKLLYKIKDIYIQQKKYIYSLIDITINFQKLEVSGIKARLDYFINMTDVVDKNIKLIKSNS